MHYVLLPERLTLSRFAPSAPNSMGFSKVLSTYSPHPCGLLRVLLLRQRIAISCKRRTEILFISCIIAEASAYCKPFCIIFHKTALIPKSRRPFYSFLCASDKSRTLLLLEKMSKISNLTCAGCRKAICP